MPVAEHYKILKVSVNLLPSGCGKTDHTLFGQCLCIDWLPGEGHNKLGVGFSNGEYRWMNEWMVN